MRGQVLILVNIPNSHFLLSLTHSALWGVISLTSQKLILDEKSTEFTPSQNLPPKNIILTPNFIDFPEKYKFIIS